MLIAITTPIVISVAMSSIIAMPMAIAICALKRH